MDYLRNTPDNEIFIVTTGDEPADWPATFAAGAYVKVVAYDEGMWTQVTEDKGAEIYATMANEHTEGRLPFGTPVAYRRENVREWMPTSTGSWSSAPGSRDRCEFGR